MAFHRPAPPKTGATSRELQLPPDRVLLPLLASASRFPHLLPCYSRHVADVRRIGLVLLHGDADRGGAERYTAQLAATLRHELHVSVIAGDFADNWPADAGEAIPLGLSGATRSGVYRSFTAGLRGHLATAGYDVVHAMLPVPAGLCNIYHPHAGIAARRTGSRQAWWTNPRRRLFARTERDLLTRPRPPIVLTLSGLVEEELLWAHPALPRDRIRRLFNGVDLDHFSPERPPLDRAALDATADEVLALFVANNFELKGLFPLIESLAGVADPRLKLLIVGRDDPAPFLHRARQLGVADRLHFAGSRDDLARLYTTADLLVLPTRRDSCSLVVLEALASGLPVVSTRTNGACEIMIDGREGLVLDRWDDVDAIAQALRRLLEPKTRAAMRAAAIDLRPALSWSQHVGTLRSIYAEAEQLAG